MTRTDTLAAPRICSLLVSDCAPPADLSRLRPPPGGPGLNHPTAGPGLSAFATTTNSFEVVNDARSRQDSFPRPPLDRAGRSLDLRYMRDLLRCPVPTRRVVRWPRHMAGSPSRRAKLRDRVTRALRTPRDVRKVLRHDCIRVQKHAGRRRLDDRLRQDLLLGPDCVTSAGVARAAPGRA